MEKKLFFFYLNFNLNIEIALRLHLSKIIFCILKCVFANPSFPPPFPIRFTNRHTVASNRLNIPTYSILSNEKDIQFSRTRIYIKGYLESKMFLITFIFKLNIILITFVLN